MKLPGKIILSGLCLGILADVLLYDIVYLGINMVLLQASFVLVVLLFVKFTKTKIHSDALVAGVFSLLFATTFAVWTSALGMVLAFFGLLFANLFLIFSLWGHRLHHQHPFQIVLDTIIYGTKTVASRFDVFKHISLVGTHRKYAVWLRGLLIALPIVLIFAVLFLQSDLVLQYQSESFINWLPEAFNTWSIIPHTLIILFFSAVFILILATAFWKRFEFQESESYKMAITTESSIILILTNVLFLAFLIFQSVYLFGGQTAFDSIPDITYSEYAVQGFNQLATVAVLVLLLILSMRYFHGVKMSNKFVHWLEVLLLVQTTAVLFSAWTRMQIYTSEYGYTPARIFGLWFFILTGLLIILLAIHIFKQLDQSKFMRQGLVVIGTLVLIFVGMAPDALSVRLNIARAQNTGEAMDPFPLFNRLSAEAYPLMDYVLNSGEVDIGLLDTNIEDYCPFVRAHYRDNKIFNFTLIVESDKDQALADDVTVRWDIAGFHNDWLATPDDQEKDSWSQRDWRSWNLSRTMVPERDQEKIDEGGIPYPADQIAHACGMYEGDLRE